MDERLEVLRKYNLWGGGQFHFGYERREYTDRLVSYTGNRLIKVLVGQQRAGKSYLLRQVAKRLVEEGVGVENTLIINRELSEFDFLSSYRELDALLRLYKQEIKPRGKIYLFIDEVQLIEGWEHSVNSYFQDYVEEYEVFLSGSNSRLLSGELATLLSGRYVTFPIFPFSFSEYCGINGREVNKPSYLEYLSGGGLPELFSLALPELRRNYMSAVKDSVLLHDVIQRYSIRDPKLLEDLFVYLVNNASSLVSVNNIVNYFKSQGRKTSYEAVSNYIRYIEDTFLVHRCERYDIRGKETIAGTAKYYINDLAYHNYLYPGVGYGLGYLLENVVYLTLRRAGFDVYTGSSQKREVDFVARKADRVLYIQSAYLLVDESTLEREYASLLSIEDNFEKFVVTLDDLPLPLRSGIRHLRAWQLEEVLGS